MSNPMVLMETSSGDILLELFEDKAPATVANFLRYVDEDFYSYTIFHRVLKDFMIQGGDFTRGDGTGGNLKSSGHRGVSGQPPGREGQGTQYRGEGRMDFRQT